jgi:hypothetical protein
MISLSWESVSIYLFVGVCAGCALVCLCACICFWIKWCCEIGVFEHCWTCIRGCYTCYADGHCRVAMNDVCDSWCESFSCRYCWCSEDGCCYPLTRLVSLAKNYCCCCVSTREQDIRRQAEESAVQVARERKLNIIIDRLSQVERECHNANSGVNLLITRSAEQHQEQLQGLNQVQISVHDSTDRILTAVENLYPSLAQNDPMILDTSLHESSASAPPSNICHICCDARVNAALVPCGHVFCETCITSFTAKKCPDCRRIFSSHQRIYV